MVVSSFLLKGVCRNNCGIVCGNEIICSKIYRKVCGMKLVLKNQDFFFWNKLLYIIIKQSSIRLNMKHFQTLKKIEGDYLNA